MTYEIETWMSEQDQKRAVRRKTILANTGSPIGDQTIYMFVDRFLSIIIDEYAPEIPEDTNLKVACELAAWLSDLPLLVKMLVVYELETDLVNGDTPPADGVTGRVLDGLTEQLKPYALNRAGLM